MVRVNSKSGNSLSELKEEVEAVITDISFFKKIFENRIKEDFECIKG